MEITAAMVKELRSQSGAGIMECKSALKETSGDIEAAITFLRKKGLAKADKKSDRQTGDGSVGTYIHAGNKLGVMVELNCETDFVANTPENIIEKIVSGKMEKFYEENCVLEQPFIKDTNITVQELIKQKIALLGENINIGRFVRFEV